MDLKAKFYSYPEPESGDWYEEKDQEDSVESKQNNIN
jgi:hypothetical protein